MKPLALFWWLLLLWLATACDLQVVGSAKSAPPLDKKVYLSESDGAFTLYKDNQPFRIHGASGDPRYIRQLAEAGGNCLRVYDTLGLAEVFDTALHYGIAIIADLPLPKSQYLSFYQDQQQVKAQFHAYRDLFAGTKTTLRF